jgi:cytochrome oxidase Cu insertion factor (SCO1/SenC/PrrC family)
VTTRTVALVVLLATVTLAPLAGVAAPPADRLTDLLWDLSIVPLEGEAPRPFTLRDLGGRPVSLADLKGRAVLLYFWVST